MLPKAGSYQGENDHDLLFVNCLWRNIPLSLPHLIINRMIKEARPIKSTSSLPYGMLMTLIFRCFGVPLDDEARDDEVLTWGEKIFTALK